MSNQSTDRNHSGGNRGDRGRRNRGGRNRGDRNRGGNQGNRDSQGQRQGQGQGNRSEFRPPRQESRVKPKPLTWWQRLLSAIGLWKAPAAPAPRPPQDKQTREPRDARESRGDREPRGDRESRDDREPRQQRDRSEAPRSNTRIARSQGADGSSPIAQGAVDSPRLYVGNLSYEATESDLEDLFKGFGSVRSVEIVYNRRTQISKGYSFVEMHHLDDAKRAVEVLHDQPFMGRKLTVNSAKSRGPGDDYDDDGPEPTPARKPVAAAPEAPAAPVTETAAPEAPAAPVTETAGEPANELAEEPVIQTVYEASDEPAPAPADGEPPPDEKDRA